MEERKWSDGVADAVSSTVSQSARRKGKQRVRGDVTSQLIINSNEDGPKRSLLW
jgi:hypothetical protein